MIASAAEKYSSYWYEKGVKDITNGLRLRHRELRAKNVVCVSSLILVFATLSWVLASRLQILFIGDGMGINTQTGKMKGRNQLSVR